MKLQAEFKKLEDDFETIEQMYNALKPVNRHLHAENRKYKDALEHILEYWNKDENSMAMFNALWHILDTAEEALK